MSTKTRHDVEALRLERDRRWDAGETIEQIDADFTARGIDPRTLGAVGSSETAGQTRAAADGRSIGDRGEAVPAPDATVRRLADTFLEVLGPALQAWEDVRDATDDLDDDAELGKHVRFLVQQWAAAKIDGAIARETVPA
jgi:hypothetical protein